MSSHDNLVFENGQLRAELKAQQAVCQKLRNEKEEALAAVQEAVEEIEALREELEMRERMCQELREAKEREVSELLGLRQDLEMRLQRALEGEGEGGSALRDDLRTERGWSLQNSSLPEMSASELVNELGQWDGMEDTLTLFQGILRTEKASNQWAPGSPWTSSWRFVVRVYISAPADTLPILERFMEECLPLLREQCKENSCSLQPVHLCTSEITSAARSARSQDHLIEVCSSEVQRSDLFVGILKHSADGVTKAEVEHGYLNNPNVRPTVFLFLPPEEGETESGGGALKLKQRIKRVSNSTKVIEETRNVSAGLHQLTSELKRILAEEFSLKEYEGGDSDGVFDRIGLLEDMRTEWEQVRLLKSHIASAPPTLVGTEEVFERLESYLTEEGPVAPLLVTGHPGLGKTTIVSKWIEHLSSAFGEKVVVFHHFVKYLGSTTSEASIIIRRFMQKIAWHCSEGASLPDNPLLLEDSFMLWLQKLSLHLGNSGPEIAVLVIDRADLITDCAQHLAWIVQPLPNNIRVVLTANEENYPDSWMSLPSPTIPTPTSSDLQDIVNNVQKGSKTQPLSLEQVGMMAVDAPPIPLWCEIATRHLLSLADDGCPDLDEAVERLTMCQEVPDLVKLVLDDLESSYPTLALCMEQVLRSVYWSRNGLLLSEVSEVTGFHASLVTMVTHELRRRLVLSDAGGLIHISHDPVQEAIQMKYMTGPGTEDMLLSSSPLVSHFSDVSRCLMSRCAEELPWLLKRAEWREELYHTILNMDLLIQIYCSGHGAELFTYWKYLDSNVSIMTSQYYKSLRKMEEEAGDGDLSLAYVASLFGTVGRILRNLGLMDEALPALQYSLELHESHSDPDGPDVGVAMCELAALYSHLERHSAAEGFYRQALQILESNCGEDSTQVLKVLESLSAVYKKLDNNDMAESLTTRIYSIRENQSRRTSAITVLKSRAQELDRYCSSQPDNSLGAARRLNQLAVIFTLYGDSTEAEELFMRSQRAYEVARPDQNHVDMLQTLRNLGAFYMQSEKFDWATPQYERAYEMATQHLPRANPTVVDTVGKLALLYREQGRLEEAEPLQRLFIELGREQYGPTHVTVAKAVCNLAVMYCLQQDYARAIPLFDEGLRSYAESVGSEHPAFLSAHTNRQRAVDLLQSLAEQ